MRNLYRVVPPGKRAPGHRALFQFVEARVRDRPDRLRMEFRGQAFPGEEVPVDLPEVSAWNNPPGALAVRLDQMVFAHYAGMDFPRAVLAEPQPSTRAFRRAWNMLPRQVAEAGRRGPRGKGDGGLPVPKAAGSDAAAELRGNAPHRSEATLRPVGWWNPVGWSNEDGKWRGGVRQVLTAIRRLTRQEGNKDGAVRHTSSFSPGLARNLETLTGRLRPPGWWRRWRRT